MEQYNPYMQTRQMMLKTDDDMVTSEVLADPEIDGARFTMPSPKCGRTAP